MQKKLRFSFAKIIRFSFAKHWWRAQQVCSQTPNPIYLGTFGWKILLYWSSIKEVDTSVMNDTIRVFVNAQTDGFTSKKMSKTSKFFCVIAVSNGLLTKFSGPYWKHRIDIYWHTVGINILIWLLSESLYTKLIIFCS